MHDPQPAAIVVGAGLSGLTAAWRLQQAGWKVRVFESENRVGGRVQTVHSGGYAIDTGATAIASSYHAYLDLIGQLGLSDRLVGASSIVGVMRNGRVHELDGLHIARSGLSSRLLSWRAKLRLWRIFTDVSRARNKGWLDYTDMRKSAPLDTETSFVYADRELGPELRDYFCDPMTRVMLIANHELVSRVELFSALANIFDTKLYGLRGGLATLPITLANQLHVELNATVKEVHEEDGAVLVSLDDSLGKERIESANACVVACTLPAAVSMCAGYRNLLQALHEQLEYTSAITVALGFNRVPQSRAMVVQVPSKESANIAILFLEHNKVPDNVPPGHALITADWECGAAKRMFEEPDDLLVAQTANLMRCAFPELATAEIELRHVTRWLRALPLTRPGVYQAIGAFNAALDESTRVQFAGDYMSAAGQNTAVTFGNKAAANLIRHFGNGKP